MAVATAVKPSLTIKQYFAASPAQVYKAWTDPKALAQWVGPIGTTAVEAEADVRTGGRYRIRMIVPDYEHNVSGVYREVVQNEKIVLQWEAAEGAAGEGEAEMAGGGYDTTVTMTFKALDESRTLVEIAEQGWRETPAGLKASYGNCQGWSQMLCALKVDLEYDGANLRDGMYA